jgi:hypothetical protein
MREGQTKHIEREFETGKDESWAANMKRLFDEFLSDSLESKKSQREALERMLTNALGSDDERGKIGNLALANAVETSNLLGKSAVNMFNVAGDRTWNLDEVSKLASYDARHIEQLGTIVAAKLAEILGPAKK